MVRRRGDTKGELKPAEQGDQDIMGRDRINLSRDIHENTHPLKVPP